MLESVREEVSAALEYRSRLLSLCSKVLDELFTIEQDDLLPKIRYVIHDSCGSVYYVMPGSSYVLSLDSNSFDFGSFSTAVKCELVTLDNSLLESLLRKFDVDFV